MIQPEEKVVDSGEVVASEEAVDIEEQIQYFPGYEDPFWYERKKESDLMRSIKEDMAQVALALEKKRPNTVSSGTQPDIEIRWKNYPKQAGTNHMIEFLRDWED